MKQTLTRSYPLIIQNIKMAKLNPLRTQQLHRLPRKPTPRLIRIPLHKQHNLTLIHQLPHTLLKLLSRLVLRRLIVVVVVHLHLFVRVWVRMGEFGAFGGPGGGFEVGFGEGLDGRFTCEFGEVLSELRGVGTRDAREEGVALYSMVVISECLIR